MTAGRRSQAVPIVSDAIRSRAMKIGINLMLLGDAWATCPRETLRKLAAIGYQHIEVPVFQANPARWREIGQIAADENLSVSVSSALPPAASLVGGERSLEAAVRFHSMLVNSARLLGAGIVAGPLYHPVGSIAKGSQRELQDRLCTSLSETVGPVYVGSESRFAMEPLNRFETNVLNTCADGARICAEVAQDWLGILADSFHMHIEEKATEAALESLGSHWIHTHASENHRGTLGTGQVDWPAWKSAWKATGPELIIFESFGHPVAELAAATRVWRDVTGDPLGCARQSYRFLRSLGAARDTR